MLRKFNKKTVLIALSVVAVLAVAGTAVAYFTNSGSGTGSATVGTSVAATVDGTSTAILYPGDPAGIPVSITVTNNGAGSQQIDTVHFTGADAFAGPGFTNPIPVGTGAGQCDVAAFTMANVLINEDLAAGATTSGVHTGTLKMADTGVSQDGCKNAVLRLNLTSN